MSNQATNGSFLEKKVYEDIRMMITNGELKPGDKIIQDQMANRLGVSRTPLRRAFSELERDYYLEITAQGVFVNQFSTEFLTSIWEVRAVLEGLACRLSAERMDDATVLYLRTLFANAYPKFEEGNYDPYHKADRIFHTTLLEEAKNPVLKRNIENTQVLSIALDLGILRSPEETYQEHMDILDAIEVKDSERAEKLMLEHIRKTTPLLAEKADK
ncbi:FCD domain-containing protein [Pontibacillus yanchengensis]|uniref:FCD domain-containing protein n=2 Tax=Pontibacillus yanchengensis TaxID=462910 RepID=A0ACC7VEX4_9BACI|nr:GntR family transcriptional regulator [Pontibacillus yanchengensis]MYL32164.1 FCD domain-containing protein [Pontibacillus yanchengensis]MYL52744.1 FCD domain-containing protein [Pontibacillus yanchengensis]